MNAPELLIYTIRPDNTPLWLPEELATLIGAQKGDKLTPDSAFSCEDYETLCEKHLAEQKQWEEK